MSEACDADEVGPLAEEAAKLLGALSRWAREHAGEAGEGLSGLASEAASAVHGVDEHFATGAAECTVCPLCRTVHAVRHLSPEVKTHLTAAIASLTQAAVALATTTARPTESDVVETIDLDANDEVWSDY